MFGQEVEFETLSLFSQEIFSRQDGNGRIIAFQFALAVYVLRVSDPILRPHNVSFNIVNEQMSEWIKA